MGVVRDFVAVEHDVVANRVGRPEADGGVGGEPVLGDDPVEHLARVVIERLRDLADLRILQDRGKASDNSQAWKNGVQSMYSASSASE